MLTASRAGTKRFQKLLNLPRRHRFTSTLVDSQQKYAAEGLVEYKRNVSINNYKYHFRRCSFQPLVKVEAKDASQPLHFKNGIKPSFKQETATAAGVCKCTIEFTSGLPS